jgi:hypothetical protein
VWSLFSIGAASKYWARFSLDYPAQAKTIPIAGDFNGPTSKNACPCAPI